ncbi:MAG: hypothetical protein DI533_01780 [Cereibacter sphaeroides]|uniref:DUF2852 domain-containing protein n=1 Tax=Cereibacter sphaeroides TaxID=1063 RepID=A0A2W5S8S1_CERSP|nr:MAG: hypothetical protein DI533_01780 [Cereibacter sphaeroides]
MTTMTSTGITSWPARAEAWLDDRGKPAWIAAMILGFIFFWPAGLALLAYMIWSKRMFNRSFGCGGRRAHRHNHMHRGAWMSSGNTAFDAYKNETLRRLEEEQEAFETFLQRLRDAKDKQEFDAFMEQRARDAQTPPTAPETPAPGQY